ncbi:MAG: YggS family pyridoxal phosphate-dependent enzyme [Acidimicrobiaceae bacterium]|nr:YggS family pyridoxal phosphate-dependent enzyme [Acidimicrobiaceae bacterium]
MNGPAMNDKAMNDPAMNDKAMNDPATIRRRLERVRARIAAAGGDSVRIVAVTKGCGVQTMESAIAAGCCDVAESYAQELLHKSRALTEHSRARARLHFVGGLQSNKVRKLASTVDVWQSIDRLDLGEELAKRCPSAEVMVQVNLSGDGHRRGCGLSEAPELVQRLRALGLDVAGLMGIGPIGEPEDAGRGFALLRGLVDRLGLAECSMGMTADLEVAVQQGATMVRIGSGLFGPRAQRNQRSAP